ncbi:hypothetical protein CNMCM5623_004583 [Aspergillus felis]|uniref:Uncharacterized protein n=1 Tax=Aspergillus felis TaxID=1287682 RepID=A0A8H6UZX0_9EURO|nr:hypothetical protein CNMCM5623_004583 [Aspergillus felis]KAF7177671.1 hypothetical protein CNMCM7691_006032 [Aspergillus felis]
MNLLVIVSVMVCSVLSGWTVGRVGLLHAHHVHHAGDRLNWRWVLTTLQVSSGPSAWITYQLLYGIGVGAGMTLPHVAVQTALASDDVSTGSALISFMQTLAGAQINAQNVFRSQLARSLNAAVLGIDTAKLADVGPMR